MKRKQSFPVTMKRLAFFMVFALVLVVPIVSAGKKCVDMHDCTVNEINAQTVWAYNPSALVDDDAGGRTATNNGGATLEGTIKKIGDYSTYFHGTTTNPLVYADDAEMNTMKNLTVSCWYNGTETGDNKMFIIRDTGADNPGEWRFSTPADNTGMGWQIAKDSGGGLGVTPNGLAIRDTNSWELLTGTVNQTNGNIYVYLFVNGTPIADTSAVSAEVTTSADIILGGFTVGGFSATTGLDACSVINISLDSDDVMDHLFAGGVGNEYPLVTPDSTPPEIDFYNMTSEGGAGCINWNTDKTNPCVTNDTTPTVFLNTSENAFCAIDVSDSNYTTMTSSRNCTGGEGTKEHTCTLIPGDELTQENSNIYISCKDENDNENTTSSSGALAISIHAKETGGSQAIGIGIQNALLSGYTTYTSQQVSARDLSNNQFLGTFDWVAKKASKVWAFNYISNGENHVADTFNLTPVLYVLQLTNTTQEQVTLLVETMINDTK